MEALQDAVTSLELVRLREHVDDNFQRLERWLEKLSNTVDLLSQNRERITILEFKIEQLRLRIEEDKRQLDQRHLEFARTLKEHSRQLIQVMSLGSLAVVVLTTIVPGLVSKFLN